MMKLRLTVKHLVIAVAALLAHTVAVAQIYKWTNEDGVVRYTSEPPPNHVKAPPPQALQKDSIPDDARLAYENAADFCVKKHVVHKHLRNDNVVAIVVGRNWENIAYEHKLLCLQSIYKTYLVVEGGLKLMTLLDYRDHRLVGLYSDETGLYLGNSSSEVQNVIDKIVGK